MKNTKILKKHACGKFDDLDIDASVFKNKRAVTWEQNLKLHNEKYDQYEFMKCFKKISNSAKSFFMPY